jgi:AraC-like DNA-binding protein
MEINPVSSTSVCQRGDFSAAPGDFVRAEELQAAASSILVPLRVTASVDAGFRARVYSARVGPVTVARIRGTPHQVSREARWITSADSDIFKVTLYQGGPAYVTQDDRRYRANPGDLVVLDTGRPYELSVIDTCDVVVIGLPRAMLGPHADLISRRVATPQPCDSGTRAVIADFLSGLADHIDGLPGTPGIHLADALASLIITAFTDSPPERAEVTSDLADRIIVYTLANLGDPALSVESVARRHGISPRYLHELFRRRGITFAAWVRHERLTRIRRNLQDPALATRTTAVIAARWGIRDPGHLSRALKKEFGLTAAEIRLSARPE